MNLKQRAVTVQLLQMRKERRAVRARQNHFNAHMAMLAIGPNAMFPLPKKEPPVKWWSY